MHKCYVGVINMIYIIAIQNGNSAEHFTLARGSMPATWAPFTNMDYQQQSHHIVWDEITYPFPNLSGKLFKFGNG